MVIFRRELSKLDVQLIMLKSVIILTFVILQNYGVKAQSLINYPIEKNTFYTSIFLSTPKRSTTTSCFSQTMLKPDLPYFCRLEKNLWIKQNIKTSFRLGTLSYTNELEYGVNKFQIQSSY